MKPSGLDVPLAIVAAITTIPDKSRMGASFRRALCAWNFGAQVREPASDPAPFDAFTPPAREHQGNYGNTVGVLTGTTVAGYVRW